MIATIVSGHNEDRVQQPKSLASVLAVRDGRGGGIRTVICAETLSDPRRSGLKLRDGEAVQWRRARASVLPQSRTPSALSGVSDPERATAAAAANRPLCS